MPSPVGHSLVGIALGGATAGPSILPAWRWIAFALFVANAPDLDFIPGLMVGDVNRFHHTASHSLAAAVVASVALGLACRGSREVKLRVAIVGGLIYMSHLLLDYVSADEVAPYGVPLLWPFQSGYLISPVAIFGGVRHGAAGDAVTTFMGELLSWYNLRALALEVLVSLPLLAGAWYFSQFRARRETPRPRG